MRPHVLLITAAIAATPALADAFRLPPRKPGQWEMKLQVDTAAMPPQIIRMCLDAETDKLLNEHFAGMAKSMCSKEEQRQDGDTIVLDSECKLGQTISTSHSTITGDFNDAYEMKNTIHTTAQRGAPGAMDDAAPQGPDTQETTMEAKRTGECEAGFKPGDIDLGGGRVVNVRDMPAP